MAAHDNAWTEIREAYERMTPAQWVEHRFRLTRTIARLGPGEQGRDEIVRLLDLEERLYKLIHRRGQS